MTKIRNHSLWMYAFIVAAIAFEITRELLVVSWAEEPQLLVNKSIGSGGDLVIAEGRWRRSDGGDRLVPNMVSIECSRAETTCSVTEVNLFEGSVMPPRTSVYPASFSDNSVSYSSSEGCVTYDVTINTLARHATQVRQTRDEDTQGTPTDCSVLDDRMEMVLADGWDADYGDNDFPEGFFPILRSFIWLVG